MYHIQMSLFRFPNHRASDVSTFAEIRVSYFTQVGSLPGNVAYFGGYEIGKALVPPGAGMVGDMAVGAVAQVIAGAVFTPIDVVKERLQVQGLIPTTTRHDSSMKPTGAVGVCGFFSSSPAVGAVRTLLRENGMMGLMRGYWVSQTLSVLMVRKIALGHLLGYELVLFRVTQATNAVWIPWNMLYISLYEEFKRAARAGRLFDQASAERTAGGGSGESSSPASSDRLQSPGTPDVGEGLGAPAGVEHQELPAWVLGICSAGETLRRSDESVCIH